MKAALKRLLVRLVHLHDWDRWGPVRSRWARHAAIDGDGWDGPPFQVHTQHRSCRTCGAVGTRRVWP